MTINETRIQTQTDLEETWRDLMEPLGFAGPSIWMMFIDAEGRPHPQLTKIEDVDRVPEPEHLASFADMVRDLVEEFASGGRVAFLRTRPGRDETDDLDRALCLALATACRGAGTPVDVCHLANDVLVAPIPLDDLPAAVSA